MTPTSRRIGILGGTFDPIHCGHVDLGRAAERVLGLTRVYVIPSHVPPHRQQTFASSFHRFAMAGLAIADQPNWRASDLELRHDGPSYTANTLKYFHDRGYPPSDLFFIVGADAFLDIATWRDYPRILDSTHFAVVSRPGHPATRADRSTSIASRDSCSNSSPATAASPSSRARRNSTPTRRAISRR